MRLPIPSLQPFSFLVGFITAIIFWSLVGRMRPLWGEIRAGWQKNREEAKARRSTSVEENHRRTTLRRAQGMHLAAPLFPLEEIIEEPHLLAPTARREPGEPFLTEDITSRTIPYMPAWPELAAVYSAPTLSLPRALEGGMNLDIRRVRSEEKPIRKLITIGAFVSGQVLLEKGELTEALPGQIVRGPLYQPKA